MWEGFCTALHCTGAQCNIQETIHWRSCHCNSIWAKIPLFHPTYSSIWYPLQCNPSVYLSATQTYIFTMRACNGFQISVLYIGVDSWHLSSVGKFYFPLENRHWEQQTGKWPHPFLSGRWHQDQCPYSEIILICQVGACCRYKNQALIELCHCAGLPITVQSEHPARGGRRLLSGITTLHLFSYVTELSVVCLMASTCYIRKTSIYLKCHMIIIMLSHQVGWKTMYLYGKTENLKHWFYFYTFYFSC